MATALETVPPQNLEAEESVLGAMLVSESTIEPVRADVRLQGEDFYRDRHRTIYGAILDLSNDAAPVDVLTVSEALAQRGQLDDVGGRDVIASLAAKVPAPGSAAHYALIVKQNAMLRRLDATAKRIQQSIAERDGEPSELVAQAESELAQIAQEARESATAGEAVRIVGAAEFAAVDEPGAEPLVGSDGEVLIPQGGDVMIYGTGGASKTTFGLDGACHIAAGDNWLGASVPRPAKVGWIEAEGPRALFRRKVGRKLERWEGSEIGDRLLVLESPWADFRFPSTDEMAAAVADNELDVLIVGPLSRVGMDEHGTLQEVRDFMARVDEFRTRTGRWLTVILIHHENKGGTVSGAWEGAGDTLLHAEVHARGRTTLTVQKARWSSDWHKRTLELAWTDGEGFEVIEEEERDLLQEITDHLRETPYRSAREIAAPEQAGGIGANRDAVKWVLEHNQDIFLSRTKEAAKAVNRHPSATVWEVAQAPSHLEPPGFPGGGGGEGGSGGSPLRGATQHRATTPSLPGVAQLPTHPESPAEEAA